MSKTASVLLSNGIVALPTDTVYGIAALAQSSIAISRLYDVKGRLLTKPIAISVACVADVYRFAVLQCLSLVNIVFFFSALTL